MTGQQIHLRQMVDLALGIPHAGAVDFGQLRNVLLHLVQITGNEKVSLSPFEETVGDLNSSYNNNNNNTNNNNNNSATDNVGSEITQKELAEKQLDAKFEKLAGAFESIREKVNSFENDLNSFNKFDLPMTDDQNRNAGDRLSETWQYMKLLQRIETAEKAIDKLFPLITNLLEKQKQEDEEKEKRGLPEKTEEHAEEKPGHDHVGVNGRLDEILVDMNRMKEDLTDLKDQQQKDLLEKPEYPQEDVSKQLDDIKEQLATNTDTTSENSKKLNDIRHKCTENEAAIKHLRNNHPDTGNASNNGTSTLASEMLGAGDEMNNPKENNIRDDSNDIYGSSKSSVENEMQNYVSKGELSKMDKKIGDLVHQVQVTNSKLENKVDLSDVAGVKTHLQELDKKYSSALQTLSDDTRKTKESIANIDNEDIKSAMSNFDQLRKMADEINELRKLSELKDLADNVDSLKDIRQELDALSVFLQDHKQPNDDEPNKLLLTITDRLNEYDGLQKHVDSELSNILKMLEKEKSVVGETRGQNLDDYITWDDFKKELSSHLTLFKDTESREKGYEVQLSSGRNDLLEQVNVLKRTQAHLVTNVNELVETQSKALQMKQVRPPSPVFDVSVMAAIQHLSQQNRQQLSTLQADLNLLKNGKTRKPSGAHTHPDKQPENAGTHQQQQQQLQLHNQLSNLQEYQVQLSGQLANMLEDTKDEFNRKQNHIDALYEHVDKLQKMKANKEDITSEIDVKADKQALDSKVNMSTFDERYQLLEQALQDALNRLDQFVEQEESLKDSLDKLTTDLDSKMGLDNEKKLKRFMEDRLKDIQKSRNNLPVEDAMVDFRNAAGLRKPMPLSYHCISCDRPVDVSMRGVMSGAPQNFPAKKSIGPYTSYELDQLRQSRRAPVVMTSDRPSRPCGGQHTTVNNSLYRIQKNQQHDSLEGLEKNMDYESDVSITDCVVGKDGHIYRGRFRANQLPPPIPKRIITPAGRAKFNCKHRFAHSASSPPKENLPKSRDETRSFSASNTFEKQNTVQNGSHSVPQANSYTEKLERSNSPVIPVSLPPISRDGSLVADDALTMDSVDLEIV